MRRSRRLRPVDIPRLLVLVLVQLAALFGGRYRRTEGAHVLARDAEGRILVVRTTYLGPGWMLPGGRVERGETPHDAAGRETREETGLEVAVGRLLLVEAWRAREVTFVFAGEVVGGDMDPQLGEIAEVAWVDRSEIETGSWRLHRLLTMLDEAGEGVTYVRSRPA